MARPIPVRRGRQLAAVALCTLAAAGAFRVERVIAATLAVREFVVPTSQSHPSGVAVGPDGAVWFTETAADAIGRLADGRISEYPLPRAGAPGSIVSGPDGALRFTELAASRLGRVAPDGVISEYPVPPCSGCSDGSQSALAVGRDGALWFTSTYGSAIGRMTPSGQVRWFSLPSADADPVAITTGPDGALWFGDAHGVGRLTTAGTTTQVWSGPYAVAITAGPDGNLWFSTSTIDQMGRLNPAAQRTRFFPIHTSCYPSSLASGRRALWFGCYYLNEIDSLSTTGTLTSVPVPSHFRNGYPEAISGVAVKPGGSVWFAEESANRIGRLAPYATGRR